MKLAVLQTMYDEHDNVLNNMLEVMSRYKDPLFFVTHSFERNSDALEKIKRASYYNALPNLGGTMDRMKLPAHAVSRNYSDLFRRLYEVNKEVDLIVALPGDTKITDAGSFWRRYEEMQQRGYKLYACQAKGQVFWSNDKILNRVQTDDVADFMPHLFFVDGKFAFRSRVFSEIPVINEYTTEHCLSEAFLKCADLKDIGRLNPVAINWLSYTDGVVWQIMSNGEPGRP